MDSDELKAAHVLWEYHQLHHSLTPCDGILVFGSNDPRVGAHAAGLFQRGLAPWILFSGNRGRMTEDWSQTEAETLADEARACGVPDSAILLETKATNTGENIRFSRELIANHGLPFTRGIVVQKPYMERRTIAALDVQWPEVKFLASSPELDFEAYCGANLTPEWVTDALVGDFQRILDYPAMGYASRQPTPDAVLAAYHCLVAAGHTSRMRT